MLSIASVTLCTTAPAFASERTPDARAQQFEHGLLPRVALKEQLGRTATITQRMQDLSIPGASIAVIDGGKVVFARAYGLSDNVDKTPATTETLFQAGSISKPVAALGALRLVKEGRLSLDEDVNAKLRKMKILPSDLCSDADFVRRIYLDVTGRPPTAEQARPRGPGTGGRAPRCACGPAAARRWR